MNKVLQLILMSALCFVGKVPKSGPAASSNEAIRGWTILTNNKKEIEKDLAVAKKYNINHLQLSHQLIMYLRQLKNPKKQKQINSLIKKAHKAHIKEVTVWDHALYNLDYYPDKFKTGPGGTIDLDNPNFWKWFKKDYREMLKLIPNADGLVLTFIETGAKAEDQFSQKLKSNSEKLAKVVNNIADVVIGELHKKLYIRTFAYTNAEYQTTVGCIKHLKYDDIILMMKETPHDFFLTHPTNPYAGTISHPTIIEFDVGNEFNGQGVIANTWPEYILNRWSNLKQRKNIIGYVARTDRFGTTSVIDEPSEILLYALKRYTEDTTITAENIYNEFINFKYGKRALPYLKPAFKNAFNIVSSSLYTLGTNITNHSSLNFDPYPSSYSRHVSGKWLNPPIVYIKHDINREFHYWKDIIEHIAPARFKSRGSLLEKEAPCVLEKQWVSPKEQMNEKYLEYILVEKKYAVKKATSSLKMIEKAKPFMDNNKYKVVYNTFYRTLLTARLYEAVVKAYFGYRIYARGESFITQSLVETIGEGLKDIKLIANEMKKYGKTYPKGQWDWKDDTKMGLRYYTKIAIEGWPKYGGVVFKKQR